MFVRPIEGQRHCCADQRALLLTHINMYPQLHAQTHAHTEFLTAAKLSTITTTATIMRSHAAVLRHGSFPLIACERTGCLGACVRVCSLNLQYMLSKGTSAK